MCMEPTILMASSGELTPSFLSCPLFMLRARICWRSSTPASPPSEEHPMLPSTTLFPPLNPFLVHFVTYLGTLSFLKCTAVIQAGLDWYVFCAKPRECCLTKFCRLRAFRASTQCDSRYAYKRSHLSKIHSNIDLSSILFSLHVEH